MRATTLSMSPEARRRIKNRSRAVPESFHILLHTGCVDPLERQLNITRNILQFAGQAQGRCPSAHLSRRED